MWGLAGGSTNPSGVCCPHTFRPRASTCTCSTWRKLAAAGKTPRELGDIAQLRVVLAPRSAGCGNGTPVSLDYGCVLAAAGSVQGFWFIILGAWLLRMHRRRSTAVLSRVGRVGYLPAAPPRLTPTQ